MTKFVLISDTHNQLNKIDIPEGDILLHAGDATGQGTVSEITRFNKDLGALKDRFEHIFFTPGNHDCLFQQGNSLARSLITNATLLIDEAIIVNKFKLYMSPWQKWFFDWSYNLPEKEPKYKSFATRIWNLIPDDTEILVTHGPPLGILDKLDEYGSVPGEHVGCPYLLKRIKELKQLKLHVFGHIHSGYNMIEQDGVIFVNASSCTEQYKPTNPPFVVEL